MAVQPSAGLNPIGIGAYSLDVGSGPDSFAEYEPKRERENAKALDAALKDEQGEERDRPAPVAAIEEFQETAGAVTGRIEKADALVQAASHGQLLDLGNLTGEIDSLLDLFGKLDRAGRFEEELRLMRSLNGLLALGLRWLDLIRSLRSLLDSAKAAGHTAGQAFAHHELGTLHLCAGHPEEAAEHLREAARLQEQIGDVGVHCATRHNLDCARRDLALRGGPPRLLRLAGLVAVFAIVVGGGAGLASAITHHHPVPPPPPSTAHLTVKPVGHGTVTGGGIDCSEQRSTHCTKEVVSGSKVVLTATPAKGFVVADWKGASCGSGNNTCSVPIDRDVTVTVVFASAPAKGATLTVVVDGSGTATGAGIDCGSRCVKKVPSGSTVLLTATPADGFVVTDWKGTSCGRGNSTCSVPVDKDVTVTVVFASAPAKGATLTVVVEGSGAVTGGGIDCSDQSSAPCTTEVVPGSAVGLAATPAEGYVVADWQGTSCGSGNNTCSVPVDGNVTVTVVFAPPKTATLTVVVQGSGKVTDGGSVDCAGTCKEPVTVGEQVRLRAIPGAGTALGSWSDPTCSTDTCSLTITGDTTLTVTFSSTLQ